MDPVLKPNGPFSQLTFWLQSCICSSHIHVYVYEKDTFCCAKSLIIFKLSKYLIHSDRTFNCTTQSSSAGIHWDGSQTMILLSLPLCSSDWKNLNSDSFERTGALLLRCCNSVWCVSFSTEKKSSPCSNKTDEIKMVMDSVSTEAKCVLPCVCVFFL